ncbi:extracellular solute-binding protein (family 7) [Bradyrhizobium sp. R2.2-H]|jgi:hypothetical protein|nr:extracellular solute-binding protein (family 7) [Bradyrhizobium sp. Y-H1]TCU77851.1 extracellular solute-binding protein (family 7) [Bradyrhizobium sp. R2.2-H]
MLTRRHLLATAVAAPAILRFGTGTAHAATTLKISHQFPGGTIDKGDFRDRLCRMFAAEVSKRSNGDIAAEIYPNSSLIKTNAQFSAMRKGALDISLYPMPYAGGEVPETNIGMSLLYSYVMSYLHISQSVAESIVAMHLPRWELLFAILVMVVVLGFFLPPVSIILMTAPIILPPLRAANFDIIWFGVVMTIVMEMGLIHPPVGLNIFVIRNVAPDIPLREVIWGTLPFVLLMMLAVLLLCLVPGISTWLPDLVMGPDGSR